ncbi:hypothetical protein CMI42_02990 [Candidatus Pacearchaeota archaeon]|nr:hypothetical protein [Candidatus Pacearchaeota archaeon]|tara:strand:+ start:579 stop:1151 length:573 start_codon:yes stop_codon:yes gene_type:complete
MKTEIREKGIEENKHEDNRLENTYESKNSLVRTHFRWRVDTAINMAGLKKGDVILDFGCGGGWLEKRLKDYNIHGYDNNPEKTFIDDYRNLKGNGVNKIFALDVFEHIPVDIVDEILEEFKKVSGKFDIIVSIPTENWISRKVRRLVGKKEVPDEHITSYHQILGLLKKHFKFKKKVNFFTVSHIYVFEY